MRTIYNTVQNEKGFTFLEILLTIALIGILSVSVLSLFINGIAKQHSLAKETIATYFAQSGIEQVIADKRLKGYDALLEINYSDKYFNGIKQTINIDSLSTNIKKVVTVVKWADGSDSLVTLIGNY